MSACQSVLPPHLPYQDVLARVLDNDVAHHYVVGADGRLLGVISLGDIKHLFGEDGLAAVANAHDMMRTDAPAVSVDATVGECLAELEPVDESELPVVDKGGLFLGVIRRHDILSLYTRKLLGSEDLGVMFVTKEHDAERRDYMELPSGHGVEAINAPTEFVGRTLSDLDLRRKHGLLVIGLRRRVRGRIASLAPNPNEPIEEGTILVVEGPKEGLSWISSLSRN